jgi:hypothetical protein
MMVASVDKNELDDFAAEWYRELQETFGSGLPDDVREAVILGMVRDEVA